VLTLWGVSYVPGIPSDGFEAISPREEQAIIAALEEIHAIGIERKEDWQTVASAQRGLLFRPAGGPSDEADLDRLLRGETVETTGRTLAEVIAEESELSAQFVARLQNDLTALPTEILVRQRVQCSVGLALLATLEMNSDPLYGLPKEITAIQQGALVQMRSAIHGELLRRGATRIE
jgi:hypothetical protein